MRRDPRGPKVPLILSHRAVPPMDYVREMSPGRLYSVLAYWINKRNLYSAARTEQAFEIKRFAKKQIACVKRELRRRKLPTMKPREDAR